MMAASCLLDPFLIPFLSQFCPVDRVNSWHSGGTKSPPPGGGGGRMANSTNTVTANNHYTPNHNGTTTTATNTKPNRKSSSSSSHSASSRKRFVANKQNLSVSRLYEANTTPNHVSTASDILADTRPGSVASKAAKAAATRPKSSFARSSNANESTPFRHLRENNMKGKSGRVGGGGHHSSLPSIETGGLSAVNIGMLTARESLEAATDGGNNSVGHGGFDLPNS